MSSQNHVQRREEDRGLLLSNQGDKFTGVPRVYLGFIGQKWFPCFPLNQSPERGVGLPFLVQANVIVPWV